MKMLLSYPTDLLSRTDLVISDRAVTMAQGEANKTAIVNRLQLRNEKEKI